MYSIDWAQRVYTGFCNDRTRTINIDNCLIQAYLELYYRKITRLEIQIVIVESIANPRAQELWKNYKKLVKSKAFNLDLLKSTTLNLREALLDRQLKIQQLPLFDL